MHGSTRPRRVEVTSGDGWATCGRGHRHWGRFGAAGLLLLQDHQVLLQLRSRHTHHGGTWSVPGGACNSDESAAQAALRETREEIGVRADAVRVVATSVDDHGGWSYTTVFARPLGRLTFRHNPESTQASWVALSAVADLPLHPGFRLTWPVVMVQAADLMDLPDTR